MSDLISAILGQQPGLRPMESVPGLAPFGMRYGGNGAKGLGFFGPLQTADGSVMNEFSTDDESGQYPLVVPTLSRAELGSLLAGQDISQAIYDKARAFADQRRAAGRSPFIEPGELRYPLPGE